MKWSNAHWNRKTTAALLATVFSIAAFCGSGHAQKAPAENPAPDAPVKPAKAPSTVGGKEDKAKDSQPVNQPEKGKSAPKPEPPPLPDEDDAFQQIKLFTQILELVRESYVDPEKTTYKHLISSALEGMLADLDPHSQFMHPQVFEQLKKNTDSTYEGVGITISFRNEVLSIVTVREDGPAARADILPGDQILKINQFLIKNIGLSEAVALLKGKPGETLKLTLRRPATKEVFEVEMIREVIKQDTVKDIGLVDAKLTAPYKIGYARILQFNQPTAEEFSVALDDLEKKGMDAFILDLRNNPGGLLNSAIAVCGEFVAPGTLVLTTEGREGLGNIKPYRTPATKRRERSYPLAILVNYSSASGSEVVAGALQDLNRAIIVGETTFGKGSVQSILPTGDGTAIRMTTAKYYTPSRRTIHENGVSPNIVSALTPDEERQLMRWWQRNSLPPEERKEVKEYHDRQLIRAIDAMKGALVYTKRNGKLDTGKTPVDPKSTTQPEPEKKAGAGQAKPESEAPDKPKPGQSSDPKKKPAPEGKKSDDKAQ